MKISTQNFRLFTPEKCQRMAETAEIHDMLITCMGKAKRVSFLTWNFCQVHALHSRSFVLKLKYFKHVCGFSHMGTECSFV